MTVHFIGLGGIGMSALARILLQKGCSVQGSDQQASLLLQELQKEGAKIHKGHDPKHLGNAETVVYSSGIDEKNCELIEAKKKGLKIYHRSELLEQLSVGKLGLFVTGTHGKTTTTALLATVLMYAGLDPSFVIGGLLQSTSTNGKAGKGNFFVAEADESDGSFLKTTPFGAIVTNLNYDHLDYWASPRIQELAFRQFFANVANKETLFWCIDDPHLRKINPKGASYGFSKDAEWHISQFQQNEKGIVFNLGKSQSIELSLFGKHNALNGAAVFGLARRLNISEEIIRKAFAEFKGTGRRLECKGESHSIVVFDDYAHHPEEVRSTLEGLRSHVRERRLVAIFQPHRYSRVRDQWNAFSHCFKKADLVVMTDIYGASEKPIPGITSRAFFKALKEQLGESIQFISRKKLEQAVVKKLRPHDVVITLGAGDITKAGPVILDLYGQENRTLTIGVIHGGSSAEHDVSNMSAQNICNSLDPQLYKIKNFTMSKQEEWILSEEKLKEGRLIQELRKCDVCIPVLHGPRGEDGMIPAFLDALKIPYVGCDYQSAAICMQKAWTKHVAIHHQVPTGPFIELHKGEIIPELPFPFPVWVKPTRLGSSIGVSRALNEMELNKSIEFAFSYDEAILIEQEIVGRQIEFALLGNDFIQIAEPGEIVSHGAFVAYDKKYGPTAMEIRVPAFISDAKKIEGKRLAETMYRACGCKGLARIDFFLSDDEKYWFNETNPFPGFTDTSAYPKMWTTSGKSMKKLVNEMILLALHRTKQ